MVYGIDFSKTQIDFATDLNKEYIKEKRLKLFCKSICLVF